jgi:hypothetical protein
MKRQGARRQLEGTGNVAGGIPSGPATTSNRKTSRRLSWASAALASIFFIFHGIFKKYSIVNELF